MRLEHGAHRPVAVPARGLSLRVWTQRWCLRFGCWANGIGGPVFLGARRSSAGRGGILSGRLSRNGDARRRPRGQQQAVGGEQHQQPRAYTDHRSGNNGASHRSTVSEYGHSTVTVPSAAPVVSMTCPAQPSACPKQRANVASLSL
jgi:hypothetical protein